MDRFTLFIVLPWDEVCSVRNLPSGVTVKSLCCRLELLSGCPAYTYRMVSSDGRVLQDDQPLVMSVNVWDGYMVRLLPLEKWKPVYDGVIKGNLDEILSPSKAPAVDQNNEEEKTNPDADGGHYSYDENIGDVALYLSCWFGHSALCKQLLDAGVDANALTPFGRSPLFACAVKDNDRALNILMKYGAKSNYQDLLGETVLDVAKKNIARQCINRIRSFQANRIQPTHDIANDVEYHSRLRNTKGDKKELKERHQRQTKSAKILSANSNTDLLGKGHDRDEDTNSKNTKFPGKDGSFDSGMTRSVTHDAGFSSNHRKMKHVHVCPSQHTVQRHSPQLVTPRSLRNFSDSDSRANTPRSPPPMMALRVALPRSKCSDKKPSHRTVTWDEQIASSDFFSGSRDAKAKTFISLPCDAMSNGFRDTDDNSNSWQLIGQSFSPLQTARSLSPEKNQTINLTGSNEEQKDEITNNADDTSNVNETHKENEEPPGKSSPTESLGLKKSKAKKPWSARRQQLATIHKNSESLKTAQRRIQLLEQQKRDCKKKETFEQWLKKKRRQKLREESSGDSSDSSDDEERQKSNTQAFNNWIKEVEERNIKQINPNSAISLHKRKSRALQGLIGIGSSFLEEKENSNGPKDTSSYMHSYKTWRKNRADRKENVTDNRQVNGRRARKDLDALRNNVLAEAISFEEWMEHAEERKTLTKIISQSKYASSEEVNNPKRSHSASKQLSFEKWKQELETKEAKRKIAQLRKRRQQEQEQLMRDENRSSSAVAHEVWVKKVQSQQKEKQRQQDRQSPKKGNRDAIKGREYHPNDNHSNQTKQTGFESWVNTKHESEIQKIDSSIRHEQQLLEELRHKKESLAT